MKVADLFWQYCAVVFIFGQVPLKSSQLLGLSQDFFKKWLVFLTAQHMEYMYVAERRHFPASLHSKTPSNMR